MNRGDSDESEFEFVPARERILNPLADLLSAAKENVDTVSRAIMEDLTTAIQSQNHVDAELAIEINTYLPLSLRRLRQETIDESQIQLWKDLSAQIYDNNRPKIKKLAKEAWAPLTLRFGVGI